MHSKILFASPSHSALLGYRPEELVVTHLATHIHPDDVGAPGAAIALAVDGQSQRYVARLQHREGHWLQVEGVPTVIPNSGEKVASVLVVSREVHRRASSTEQAATRTSTQPEPSSTVARERVGHR